MEALDAVKLQPLLGSGGCEVFELNGSILSRVGKLCFFDGKFSEGLIRSRIEQELNESLKVMLQDSIEGLFEDFTECPHTLSFG